MAPTMVAPTVTGIYSPAAHISVASALEFRIEIMKNACLKRLPRSLTLGAVPAPELSPRGWPLRLKESCEEGAVTHFLLSDKDVKW